MSILSSTQGTPERVYAIIQASRQAPALAVDELFTLFNPGVAIDGEIRERPKAIIDNVQDVSKIMGLGEDASPMSFISWSDEVHDRLLTLADDDLDAVVLRSYAWIVAESYKRRNVSWFLTEKASDLSDLVKSGLGQTANGDPSMNTTKLPALRKWLVFLGLLAQVPLLKVRELPTPAKRIHRELKRSDLSQGKTLSAEEFVSWIAAKMPYLDGGRLFTAATERMPHLWTAKSLSPVLSIALQDLHDRDVIRLQVVGDTGSATRLNGDSTHKFTSFHAVEIRTV